MRSFNVNNFSLIICILFQLEISGKSGREIQLNRSNKNNKSIYLPLIDYLKKGYNPLAVPICDNKTKFHVFMDIWLYQLFDLDEPTQMLTIDVWMEMSWFDCMLTWNPSKFNDITQLTLPAAEIYYPDLIWYQSLHGNFEEGMFLFPQSIARIRSNGIVQLGAQGLLKSFCRIDIRLFPFDVQKCNLTFASWNRDSSVFNLTKKDNSETPGHSFKNASNGEWEVIEFPAYNSLKTYKFGSDEDGNGSKYAEVTFQLTLQRKPTFIKIYLIFPCVLLVWISSLTFLLPIECGEKINLCVTILLSVIVFLLLVSENIPRTSDGIPTLGVFFCTSIGLVCLSVLMTTLVLNISEKGSQVTFPECLKKIIKSKIMCLLCFRYNQSAKRQSLMSMRQHSLNETNNEEIKSENKSENKADEITNQGYWRILAMLLDRLFFIIYVIFAILNTAYIYAKEPMIRNVKDHVT